MALIKRRACFAWSVAGLALSIPASAIAQTPSAIESLGTVVLKVHAEGAQIYECKAGTDGKLGWIFREPIATLLADGKTVGRHYAGPNWETSDGSAVTGKVSGTAPGTSAGDIPWLRLDIVAHRGSGQLDAVTAVQRIDTHGGDLKGSCETAGAFFAAPYSADYVFLKKN